MHNRAIIATVNVSAIRHALDMPLLTLFVARFSVIHRIIQAATKEGIGHHFVIRVVGGRGAAPVDTL